MTQEIKCPCCCNVLTPDSEQAICLELFGECIFCRFSPNSKGSKSGTQAELAHIVVRQEAKRRFNNQQPKTINMHQAVWDTATRVPEGDIRAFKHRIHELEGELMGYKKVVAEQDQILQRRAEQIVGLQDEIRNLTGEE